MEEKIEKLLYSMLLNVAMGLLKENNKDLIMKLVDEYTKKIINVLEEEDFNRKIIQGNSDVSELRKEE